MVFDLETEKIMDGLERAPVRGFDPYPSARCDFFKAIGDLAVLFFHDLYTRRHLVMNEHRNGEVAIREHGNDMGQMGAYGMDTLRIFTVVGDHLNSTTVRIKAKVMGRLVV